LIATNHIDWERKVRLADFVGERESRKWGTTRYTLPLKEALTMQENGASRPEQKPEPMPRLIKTPEWFNVPETRYPDAAAVVRQQFATVKEAEAYAQSLGVHAVYEDRLDIAQLASEFLARLQNSALQMPLTLMVHLAFFAAKYPDALEVIPAMAENGVMMLNPAAQHWNDPLAASRTLYAIRYWSTPSPLHVFFHEYAHLFQSEATRNKPLTARQMTLAEAISVRAQANVEEFLSEVYAGLAEGVQYDSEIMGAYRRLKGKKR
jgi:hypothetical protein